jgi:hypothetical protein
MSRTIYLVLSVAAFLAAAFLHVVSYFREPPRLYLHAASIAAAVLCVPLVALFIRLKREKGSDEIWPRFWHTVLERCPRWIWGAGFIAWLLGMLAFVRGIFGAEQSPLIFQSAFVLIPISAALSYAVTLCRR